MTLLDRVPATLEGAVELILNNMSDEDKNLIAAGQDIGWHMGFGMWMRNNWGLWNGSPLQTWFLDRKIYHADDMSGIITDAVQCKIRNQEFKLGEAIKYYHNYWEGAGYNIDDEIERVKKYVKEQQQKEIL